MTRTRRTRAGILLPVLAVLFAGFATAQSPRLVRDVLPGAGGSMAGSISSIVPSHRAGEVFLVLDDGVHGAELWRSDGSAAGTTLVVDLTPGAGSTAFGPMGVSVDGLWFVRQGAAGPELWRSDGTAAGTVLVLDGAALGATSLTPPEFRFADGSFVLDVDTVLVRSDGTAAGTRSLGVPAGSIFDAGGGALWVLDGGLGQLWFTDGIGPTGTILATGVGSVAVAFGGLLIGQAAPGGGTTLRTLGVSPPRQVTLPEPVRFWARGDGVIAFGTTRLWSWDAASAPRLLGTFVAVQNPIIGFLAFAQDGRSVLFFPDDGVHGLEPWWTDGTPAGTRLLADITPGPQSTIVGPGFSVEDRVVFWANTRATGSEPWTTDGTPAGTMLLGDLEPGQGNTFTDAFSGAGGVGHRRVVLPIMTSAYGYELWVSDGTPAGTRLLGDVVPGPVGSVQLFGYWAWTAGTSMIVALDDGVHGFEPYAVDLVAASAPLLGGCSTTARYDARDPVLGTPWQLAARGVALAGLAFVALPAASPLRLGSRCAVQLDVATTVTLASIVPNAAGDWSGAYPLPSAPNLVGARLATQAVFLDPSAPLGFAIGDAWFATLGF